MSSELNRLASFIGLRRAIFHDGYMCILYKVEMTKEGITAIYRAPNKAHTIPINISFDTGD